MRSSETYKDVWERIIQSAAYPTEMTAGLGDLKETRHGTPFKGRRIATIILGLLLLSTCAVAYDVRVRVAGLAGDVTRFKGQLADKESQIAQLHRERLQLKMENGSLAQENEATRDEIARLRETAERLRFTKQEPALRKDRGASNQPGTRTQAQVPTPLLRPPALMDPPERPRLTSKLDVLETAHAKIYTIR